MLMKKLLLPVIRGVTTKTSVHSVPFKIFDSKMSSKVGEASASPNCVFCKISTKEVPSNILYEDDRFCVFPDHKPAAENHFLVIPKVHIHDVKSLGRGDVDLVKEMEQVGLDTLKAQLNLSDLDNLESEIMTGFHWPIHTVSHLHMHVIYPPPQRLIPRIVFSSFFFGSVDQAIEMLEKK